MAKVKIYKVLIPEKYKDSVIDNIFDQSNTFGTENNFFENFFTSVKNLKNNKFCDSYDEIDLNNLLIERKKQSILNRLRGSGKYSYTALINTDFKSFEQAFYSQNEKLKKYTQYPLETLIQDKEILKYLINAIRD